MGDVKVTGTEQFVQMAKQLNAQGKAGRGLWKELNDSLKEAAKPMVDEVLVHLQKYLPNRYAVLVRAALTVRVSRSTKGSGAGLKLVGTAKGAKKKRHLQTIETGVLRHPVFGNHDVWVNQRVKPGFFSEPLTNAREIPAKEIRRAIQNTIRKLN